jgi:hypothetical protein
MSNKNQKDDLGLDNLEADSLDSASRRELLAKLARVGAAAVPVSVVMLDAKKAAASTGSDPEGDIGF